MIVFIKKSSAFLLCTIFLCVMMIAGIILGNVSVPAAVNASYGKTVVIDAGHGDRTVARSGRTARRRLG